MKEKMPKKPVHIPQEAVWNPNEEWWECGDWGIAGTNQIWHKMGYLYHENHRDDNGAGWTKRYHPDGTVANFYTYKHHLEDGPAFFQRCKELSLEFFPAGPHASVWKAEVEFRQAKVVRARYFLKDGTEVPCYGIGEPDEALETLLSKSPYELLYGMTTNIDKE